MTVRTLIAPNFKPLERDFDLIGATRINAIAVPLRTLWSAQDCPENLLPWLASSLSVENWDSTVPLTLRRARVAQAISIHRRKGTVSSIRDVIATYGGTVVLSEWWQQVPKGIPHSFTLSLTLGGQVIAPTPEFIDGVIADVTRTKPLRSFFTFTVALNATGAIAIARAARAATFARLSCHEA